MNSTILITLISWNNAPQAMKDAFIKRMEGYQYGAEETTGAWAWYVCGWQDGATHLDGLVKEAIRI